MIGHVHRRQLKRSGRTDCNVIKAWLYPGRMATLMVTLLLLTVLAILLFLCYIGPDLIDSRQRS